MSSKQITIQSKPKCLCEICTCVPKTHVCEICGPSIPFDHTSSYQNDYVPKEISAQLPDDEEYEIVKSPPFTAKTSYQLDFVEKPLPKKEVDDEDDYEPNNIPFDAKSTYQEEFIQRPIPKREEYEDDDYIVKSPKFDAKSSYTTDYIKHPYPKCDCPAHLQQLDKFLKPSPNHQYFVKEGDKWKLIEQK